MPQIAMIALTELDLDGNGAPTSIGELFFCTPVKAAQLNFARTARFAEANEVERPSAAPEPAAPPVPQSLSPEPPAPTVRKTRTYRRKDLKAEK